MERKVNEKAVWDRVTATGRALSGETESGPAAPALAAELQGVRQRAAVVRRLIGTSRGEKQRQLRGVLQLLQQQHRGLTGLYIFLTGQRPGEEKRPGAESTAETEAIRALMRETELSMGRLEALTAGATGETREALINLCKREQEMFHRLLQALGG